MVVPVPKPEINYSRMLFVLSPDGERLIVRTALRLSLLRLGEPSEII